jgi:GNAT superfamily N-acetyltransferase
MRPTKTEVLVRPYQQKDERAVLELLKQTLGEGPTGRRDPTFFRWKHLENPFGPSYMLVAESDGRIVGLRAFMRWEFRVRGRTLRAVTAVDTATHPEYQGQGIFTKLTMTALNVLRSQVDLVFNTPNEKSLPGYLKMGWQIVGRVPVRVRIRHPLRLARGARSMLRSEGMPAASAPTVNASRAGEVLADAGVDSLVERAFAQESRIATRRTGSFLGWRYGVAPLLDYRALRLARGGRTTGLAIFRLRPRGTLWESTISELLVEPGDHAGARELLRRVVRAAPVDHLTCHVPPGSTQARAMLRGGFIPSRTGIMFVVNPFDARLGVDVTDLRSWALSLGDLEVF